MEQTFRKGQGEKCHDEPQEKCERAEQDRYVTKHSGNLKKKFGTKATAVRPRERHQR